ncbi:MAG TPA: putative beta-lysine N-acetyltransferase [Anoxybacillus sp.]|nr:putative beta-lysine N-acetyltransferase [Anoxybacillus sp.]
MPADCPSNPCYVNKETYWCHIIYDDFNKRLRVEDYRGHLYGFIPYIEKEAKQKLYEKIIVKARLEHVPIFIEKGFINEGWIQGYFNGSDAYFLAKYLTAGRRRSDDWCREDEIIHSVQSQTESNHLSSFPDGFLMRKAEKQDAIELSGLYKTVFAVYPTPLQHVDYILHVLKSGTIFYVIEKNGKIVSAASAEVNETYHNAELTDCATLPEHRKHGLMKYLIRQLEEDLRKDGIFCAYSLARAKSFGMNAVFHQLGYQYAGRLMNNCYIYQELEDMNVWFKDLAYKQ